MAASAEEHLPSHGGRAPSTDLAIESMLRGDEDPGTRVAARTQRRSVGRLRRLVGRSPTEPEADEEGRAITEIDRLLFGHNHFFGVNHMSEEKARAQQMRFQDTEAIHDVLDSAHDEGIRTSMCTTHDRIEQVAAHVWANPARYPDFKLVPGMPFFGASSRASIRCARELVEECWSR